MPAEKHCKLRRLTNSRASLQSVRKLKENLLVASKVCGQSFSDGIEEDVKQLTENGKEILTDRL